jgi:hypothetical protein
LLGIVYQKADNWLDSKFHFSYLESRGVLEKKRGKLSPFHIRFRFTITIVTIPSKCYLSCPHILLFNDANSLFYIEFRHSVLTLIIHSQPLFYEHLVEFHNDELTKTKVIARIPLYLQSNDNDDSPMPYLCIDVYFLYCHLFV